jgi:two-component system OmpR family sensor kinase
VDRRALRAPSHQVLTTPAVTVACLTGLVILAVAAFFPAWPASPVLADRLARVEIVAGALAIAAGVAGAVRWKIDGCAPAWWTGVGLVLVGIPALTTTPGTDIFAAVHLAFVTGAVIALARACTTPAVDTSIAAVRTAAVAAAALAVGTAGSWLFLHAAADNAVIHLLVGSALIALALRAERETRTKPVPTASLVPTLVGLSLAELLAASVPATSALHAGGPSLVRLATAGFAAVAMTRELHAAGVVQRAAAFRSQLQRDEAEARRSDAEAHFHETLHEVRSTVVALEGGARRLDVAPNPNGTETSAASADNGKLTRALVAEIERLRQLVSHDRDESLDGTYRVQDALEPLLTVSKAGGWPVAWTLPSELAACGNAADLAQVVHGLVANAKRHAPGSAIDVTARRDGELVLVQVDDHGAGVPRSRRDIVFERGARTVDTPDAGRGLGLYIARCLMRDQGGDVWVEERPGGGARFVVAVPAPIAHSEAVNEGPAHRRSLVHQTEAGEGP